MAGIDRQPPSLHGRLVAVPMTAQHADVGVLDATMEPLGIGLPWSAIHRARPRPPLSCRECGHGLHAKISPRGLKFFAHDPAAPECSLIGETIAHRLLKVQLASSIRDAGWFAELELAGAGWRADVLATSPDGARQMAWEAQLAQITVEDLRARTARMQESGVSVCWVTDRPRPWIGMVQSIQVAPPEEREDPTEVVGGLGVFKPSWCENRRRCRYRFGGPCAGHGNWAAPSGVGLAEFVDGVLRGAVRPHEVPDRHSWSSPSPTRSVWTTRPHVLAEHEQLLATEQRREQDEASARIAKKEREQHQAAILAKLARQQALTPPAVALVRQEAQGYVGVRDAAPEWAMGVPLFVHDQPQGVISPVLSRVKGQPRDNLRGLTLFVASPSELRALTRACWPGQRIVLFEVDIPDKPEPPAFKKPRRRKKSGFWPR